MGRGEWESPNFAKLTLTTGTDNCLQLLNSCRFSSCQNRVVPYGHVRNRKAPVAQLDRATVYGTVGWRFEPVRVQASGLDRKGELKDGASRRWTLEYRRRPPGIS
jgi:hypothetical protein